MKMISKKVRKLKPYRLTIKIDWRNRSINRINEYFKENYRMKRIKGFLDDVSKLDGDLTFKIIF